MVNIDTDKVTIENFYIKIRCNVMNKDESLYDIGTLNSNINDKKLDQSQMYNILNSYLIGNKYSTDAIKSIKDKINEMDDEYKKILLLDIVFNATDDSYVIKFIEDPSLLVIPEMASYYRDKEASNIYYKKNDTLEKDKDIKIIPNYDSDVHFASVLKVDNLVFFVDSIRRKPPDAYKESVRVLGHDGVLGIQSGGKGCAVFAAKIARILSFLPKDILLACVSEEEYKDCMDKNKNKINKIFDFAKLERYADENKDQLGDKYEETKKMTKAILPHILSFSEDLEGSYTEYICKRFGIDMKELGDRKFVKITNQNNPDKKDKKETSLNDLLLKYRQKNRKTGILTNYRVLCNREKTINSIQNEKN